jgi:SAM-dependent methyltransferase
MWSAVASAWEQYAEETDAQASPMTARMLDLAELRPGERVLELACGAGGLGLAAAARIAPDGDVVLSDVAHEMTAIARRRADASGVANVQIRQLDLERIEEPDNSYDVVLCREGLMFAPDPARAAREIHRVLRAGGRFAVSVWGPRESNPWLGVVFDAVGAQLGRPVPPQGVPGPFAMSDADRLGSLFADAQLEGVAVEALVVPRRAASVEEWWSRTTALAGPLATLFQSLPGEAREAIRERAAAAARPFVTVDGTLEFPGLALLVSGHRA